MKQGKAFALPLPRLHGQSEAIFNLALSFPLQRHLNGLPLAHGSTGSRDVVSHCDGKGYRVRNKSEIIRWHSWDQNSCLLPALTLSQRKEGSGYRLSRSRAHVQTLQRASARAGCEQKQNEAFLPWQIKDNLVHEVPKLPSLPGSQRLTRATLSDSPAKKPICLTLMFRARALLGTARSGEGCGRWTPLTGVSLSCWQPVGCGALPAELGLHRDMVRKGKAWLPVH